MKNIIAGVVAAAAAGAVPVAHAEIELGSGISISGFLDMSYVSSSPDEGESTDNAGIDQFETTFKFAGSNGISAQVDIEYGEGFDGSDDETFVEQAFVTKAFTDEFSVKVGRFLSYSGWETEEPTGLFQYSGTGYAPFFYGYYQNGVSAYYAGGAVDVMASVVTSAFNPEDRNNTPETEDFAYELGLAVYPVEGLTAKVFYISDEDSDTDVINAWASYSAAGFTLAGEYNVADYGDAGEADGFLVMGNYATGPFGFTVRYHDFTVEDDAGVTTFENSAITLSPSYKAGDNLLFVAEYRLDDFGDAGDVDTIALEALFTF